MARRHLIVRFERVECGRWAPGAEEFGAGGGLGLLMTAGLTLRELSLGHRAAAELLGPGDLLRPWQDDGEYGAYPFSFVFRVLDPLMVVVLDSDVTRTLMHFPEIVGQLMARVMTRARRLVGHLVISQLTSVDIRLCVALWHLSERFGRVGPRGVVLPLRVTHEVLGLMVGARRPSVTSALGRLVAADLIEPLSTGGWLLKGNPPAALAPSGQRRAAV